MEEFGIIIQSISTVGFPIVCCFLMMKNNRDMQLSHKEELDNLRQVIENNTLSITKLYEKIDNILGKDK